MFTENEIVNILEDFVGARIITEDTLALYDDKFGKVNETIYRGMPFYEDFIKVGANIEEWYGSTHWTLDFNIAKNIFSKDYINECYIEELAENLNKNIDEVYESMVPMIMRMNGTSNGARTYEMVKNLDKVSRFYKEKEITIMGMDFIITNIEHIQDEDTKYYLVDVKEIENYKELEDILAL